MIKKIKYIIGGNNFNKILKLIFANSIIIVLELLGFGLLIPLFNLLEDGGSGFKNYNFSGFNFNITNSQIIIVFILFNLLRTIILIFYYTRLNLFAQNLGVVVLKKLFHNNVDVNEPNQSSFSENLQIYKVEVEQFVNLLLSVLNMFSEVIIILSTLCVLFFLDPRMTIFGSFIVALIFLSITIFSKKVITKLGQNKYNVEKSVNGLLLLVQKGFKEVKVNKRETELKENFNINVEGRAVIIAKQISIQHYPRIILELLIFFALSTFIFFKIGDKSILPILLIYMTATFRVMPSINRIISSFQSIKFFNHSLDIVYSRIIELKTNIINTSRQLHFKSLQINDASFIYEKDGQNKTILQNFNYLINQGDVVCLFGPSGSGKSTLLDIILGFKQFSSGYLSINGDFIIDTKNPLFNVCNIGYVPSRPYITNDSIRENIIFGRSINISDDLIINYAKHLSLDTLIKEKGLEYKCGEDGEGLSDGQIQRIGILRAIITMPELLLLDEFTSSLDKDTEMEILQNILKNKSKNQTIIYISHSPEAISFSSRQIELNINNA
jgi:ABC-type bacteriocin/lantibiotic exporter with double-glycine peptidase domain